MTGITITGCDSLFHFCYTSSLAFNDSKKPVSKNDLCSSIKIRLGIAGKGITGRRSPGRIGEEVNGAIWEKIRHIISVYGTRDGKPEFIVAAGIMALHAGCSNIMTFSVVSFRTFRALAAFLLLTGNQKEKGQQADKVSVFDQSFTHLR